uniref:Uncharacterized protein MANES_06G172700 n=1 Tax=Rhizophora mucronata TaxID=61149 RepID=A0A2P2LNR0_RHIMU
METVLFLGVLLLRVIRIQDLALMVSSEVLESILHSQRAIMCHLQGVIIFGIILITWYEGLYLLLSFETFL